MRRFTASIGALSLLGACATAPQVQMKSDFWSQTDRSVAVALATLPDTAAHKAGPQGLLDVAINNAMADELSQALKKITLDQSYGEARSEVVNRLQENGIKSTASDKMIDVSSLQDFSSPDTSRSYARKDFRSVRTELGGVDRLLLFTVIAVGTQRSYYGFVPISSPVAILRARGEMIDLQTNEVLWREDTSSTAPIADPWDQPPEFKNVNAAVAGVIIEARNAMLDKLFAGAPVATAGKSAGSPVQPVKLDDLRDLMGK